MLSEIENGLDQFSYITNKSEILIYLINFYLNSWEIEKAESLFSELITVVDFETNLLARSKLCNKLIKLFLESLKNIEFQGFSYFTDILISKIHSPHYKLRALLTKLKFYENINKKELILKEIEKINEYFRRIMVNNILILIKNVINPLKFNLNDELFVEQTSIDQLFKQFIIIISDIAVKLQEINLFERTLEKVNSIRINVLREEALRDILNNFITLSIEKNKEEYINRIENHFTKFSNVTYLSEVLVNFSLFLKNKGNFAKIEDIVNRLINNVKNIKGDFSKAIFFENIIKIIGNLEEESKKIHYLNIIKNKIHDIQSKYNQLGIWLEILKIYDQLKKNKEGKDILKKIIDDLFLIEEEQLFFKIIIKIIESITSFQNISGSRQVHYLIEKFDNLVDMNKKTFLLLILAEKINEPKFHEELKKINQILQISSKPYISYGKSITNHYYLFLKYSIKQAFNKNNTQITQNPLDLVEDAHEEIEKCLLLIEFIKQFKENEQIKRIMELKTILFKKIDKISNEFEKKEILIRYIKALY
ncbi:MAG: hypothetical protein ACTSO9_02015 [Candidatus Helarchaeota archaeon]